MNLTTSVSLEKVNILLVDDQPAKLLSYEVILGELGENLIKANSANEALEQLLQERHCGGADRCRACRIWTDSSWPR